MIWYDMIWYDMIWYDMIWYDMIHAPVWQKRLASESLLTCEGNTLKHLAALTSENLIFPDFLKIKFPNLGAEISVKCYRISSPKMVDTLTFDHFYNWENEFTITLFMSLTKNMLPCLQLLLLCLLFPSTSYQINQMMFSFRVCKSEEK